MAFYGAIAVGAPEGGAAGQGAVYVFAPIGSPGPWVQQELTATDPGTGDMDLFGVSVSIDGDVGLAGAPQALIPSTTRPGSAFLFSMVGPVSMAPNRGSGLTQTFTAVYSDLYGATKLQVVDLDFGSNGIGAPHSCYVAYVQASNALYLYSDDSRTLLGPITPGTSASQSNSQCTLSGSGGIVTASGSNLTVPFALTFAAGFSGTKSVYAYAQDYTVRAGSQFLGIWGVGTALTVESVNPINGGGLGPQTFMATYTDSNGASDVQVAYLDFGGSVLTANSCIVAYVLLSNTLYLFADDSSGVLGPINAGSSSTLSNGQCTLSGTGGIATALENSLTAPFNIQFANGFSGSHNVFGLAQSYSGTTSQWTNLGTWMP